MGTERCDECGCALTPEEIEYLGRCDDCEREWLAAITAWRKGGDNAEFDAVYGDTPRTLQ